MLINKKHFQVETSGKIDVLHTSNGYKEMFRSDCYQISN